MTSLPQIIGLTIEAINKSELHDRVVGQGSRKKGPKSPIFFTAYIMAKKTIGFVEELKARTGSNEPIDNYETITAWYSKIITEDLAMRRQMVLDKLNSDIEATEKEIQLKERDYKDLLANLVEARAKVSKAEKDLLDAVNYASLKYSNTKRGLETDKPSDVKPVNDARKELQKTKEISRLLTRKEASGNLVRELEQLHEERKRQTIQSNLFSEAAFNSLIVLGATDEDKEDLERFVDTEEIQKLEVLIQQFNNPAGCSGAYCFGRRGGGRTRRKKTRKTRKTRRNRKRR